MILFCWTERKYLASKRALEEFKIDNSWSHRVDGLKNRLCK